MTDSCIICKKSDELTDEHIIPEFLGGNLTITSVCKPCNDKMGNTFDGRLSKNEIFSLPNFVYNISGKSGVPRPLEGSKQTKLNEKVYVEFSENKFKVKSYPQISIIKENGEDVFSMKIDPSDLGKAKEIIGKKINRYYKDTPSSFRENLIDKLYHDLTNRPVTESPSPIVKGSFTVDFTDLKLLFIKIAYEIGHHNFGKSFTNNPVAEILRIALYKQFVKEINVSFFPEIGSMKKLFFEDNHYVCLARNVCYIKIHGIDAMIHISDVNSDFDISSEKSIIYDFNYKRKSHLKQTLTERAFYIKLKFPSS